jgi:8-oxo-dGTP pyrophosphatase MutT (NUDIX family)
MECKDFDAQIVSLSADERVTCAGVCATQLLTITEGSAWVRGRERIWTPLLTGRCAYWTESEQQELWSPAGMRASVVEGPAAELLFAHLKEAQAAAGPGTDDARKRGRSAVRILCVNESGKVLLWRWPDHVTGGFGWLPVGGGIEPGEEPVDAARREWVEETGLAPEAVTGHHVFVHRDLWWEGERHIADEAFFLAQVEGEPCPASDDMLASECQWTPIDAIGLITEQFEPPGLAAILAELLSATDS